MSPGGTVPDFFGTGVGDGSTWMGWMGTFPICFKWAAGEPQNFQNHWVTQKTEVILLDATIALLVEERFLLDAMSFLDVVFFGNTEETMAPAELQKRSDHVRYW